MTGRYPKKTMTPDTSVSLEELLKSMLSDSQPVFVLQGFPLPADNVRRLWVGFIIHDGS
jgi:hypothetical protein